MNKSGLWFPIALMICLGVFALVNFDVIRAREARGAQSIPSATITEPTLSTFGFSRGEEPDSSVFSFYGSKNATVTDGKGDGRKIISLAPGERYTTESGGTYSNVSGLGSFAVRDRKTGTILLSKESLKSFSVSFGSQGSSKITWTDMDGKEHAQEFTDVTLDVATPQE
ncbi:MAG: hypothetical protein AAB407_01640 [Patescibacteria group bacterium]